MVLIHRTWSEELQSILSSISQGLYLLLLHILSWLFLVIQYNRDAVGGILTVAY